MEGSTNIIFFELDDGDDYSQGIDFTKPLATEGLIINQPGQHTVAARAAPDDYLHPIHALRMYLDDIGVITDVEYGHDAEHRVEHVNANKISGGQYVHEELPTSDIPGIVQPIEGIGPNFLERGVIVQEIK